VRLDHLLSKRKKKTKLTLESFSLLEVSLFPFLLIIALGAMVNAMECLIGAPQQTGWRDEGY